MSDDRGGTEDAGQPLAVQGDPEGQQQEPEKDEIWPENGVRQRDDHAKDFQRTEQVNGAVQDRSGNGEGYGWGDPQQQ